MAQVTIRYTSLKLCAPWPNTTLDELTVFPLVKYEDFLFTQRDNVALQCSFRIPLLRTLLSHYNGIESLATRTDSLNSEPLSVHAHLDFPFVNDILFIRLDI